jgi:hypothetical protein
MSGYIYTSYAGADPDAGWVMSDPIISVTPTLGACVPNIRRAVKLGDWIFSVSGRVPGMSQFVVGGFRVAEKIDQLAAFERFPENRVRREGGQVLGNVIINADGTQHPDDRHTNFERRLENYIVGDKPILLDTVEQRARARAETLGKLSEIFGRQGNRVFDVIGRFRKMDDRQVDQMRDWLQSLKR